METGDRDRYRRLALLVQYDGTAYNGWQSQKNGTTIQDEIEKAIYILTKEQVRVIASGRTDAGVHAIGQVVHFDLRYSIKLDKLCISLNGILPKDISVDNAFLVPADFHARFSAVEREYLFLIYNNPLRSPFMQFRAMWVKDRLDEEYLKKALSYLVGEHDFSSFCKQISAGDGTIREVISIDVQRNDSIIKIYIRGNAFLHHMIRIIIGTVVGMSKNNNKPEIMREILLKQNRAASGITAPPYGLYLNKIFYSPPLESRESAF